MDKPSQPGVLFVVKFFNCKSNFIYNLNIGLQLEGFTNIKYSVSSFFGVDNLPFHEIFPFHLSHWIYFNEVIYNIFSLFFISRGSVVKSPLSFFVIQIFDAFSLFSNQSDWRFINFIDIFINQFLVSLIFLIDSLFSILLISALKKSFALTISVKFALHLIVPWGRKWDHLFSLRPFFFSNISV